MKKQRKTVTRAIDVFVSKHFHDQDGGTTFAKRRQVTNAWKRATPEQKAVYQGMAASDNQRRAFLDSVDFEIFAARLSPV